MDSPFLEALAGRLSEHAVTVMRFEFDYMAQRRSQGPKRPPPNVAKLADEFCAIVEAARESFPKASLLIGGKSMGGRVASMIANEMFARGKVRGCVCVGYPFHPPKRPDQLRTTHLEALGCPTLIVQGDRDPLGTHAEVGRYQLSEAIQITWIGDGDHDLKPRMKSGYTVDTNLELAAAAIAAFAHAS